MYQPEMVSQAVRRPALVSPDKTLKGSVDLLPGLCELLLPHGCVLGLEVFFLEGTCMDEQRARHLCR